MQAIVLLGAPGAGKGTVAEGLSEKTTFQHVSTGDILREAVKRGTEVGKQAQSYMDQGELVPDDVIAGLIKERIAEGDPEDRYMFDGFPRTMEQARLLDDVIEEADGKMLAAFLLDVPEETVIKRLTGRRVCRECGAVYHVVNIPPKKEGVCDKCGGELYQRDDDTEATVKNRLSVYWKQTSDLIGYYEEKNLLMKVNADRGKEFTEAEIIDSLRDLERV